MKKAFRIFTVVSLLLCLLFTFTACRTTSYDDYDSDDFEDPVELAKEKLSDAYDSCCEGYNKTQYASLAYDNMSLTIDTNPSDSSFDDCEDNALSAIVAIHSYLGLPSSLIDKMSSTRALDGLQSQDCGDFTITWNYHPDNGMKVIYEVNS